MMLRFAIDWEQGPHVKDPLLQATWARLEIHAKNDTRELCLTDCVAERSHSLRRGVYGSVFPLAAWVVENWWSLLNESLRTDHFRGARAAAIDPALLTLYRDGHPIAARCVPDPFGAETPYPVRFVSDAELRLSVADAEAALASLVDAVIERVRELIPDSPEAFELRRNWEAVRDSAGTESRICAAAAAMGVDPYSSSELTDELFAILETDFQLLPPVLQWDLAESTAGRMSRSTSSGSWRRRGSAACLSPLRHRQLGWKTVVPSPLTRRDMRKRGDSSSATA